MGFRWRKTMDDGTLAQKYKRYYFDQELDRLFNGSGEFFGNEIEDCVDTDRDSDNNVSDPDFVPDLENVDDIEKQSLKSAAHFTLMEAGPSKTKSEGMSPSKAKHFYKSTLLATTSGDKICETLANAQVNPMERSIYHLYEQWRKENYKEKTSKSVFEELVEKKAHFEVNGIKMFLSEEPFCCVVITPLMLRGHSMHVSSEIVFVDSSQSCDQMENYSDNARAILSG
ncbi:hypothetical protein RN001_001876 [Aquatica leii]|uniref:Uncharacterized protein n=1 Tax=Aquatica leii TaxID=1421715 RepID=A0AAN7QAQ2_9COLE|nr:hypothetical protein RN001_001876 [Aquatica leii]